MQVVTHLWLYRTSSAGLVSEVFAVGASVRCESELAREAEEEGTRAISKADRSVRFVLCLGLFLDIHVIAGPLFVTLQFLGVI